MQNFELQRAENEVKEFEAKLQKNKNDLLNIEQTKHREIEYQKRKFDTQILKLQSESARLVNDLKTAKLSLDRIEQRLGVEESSKRK